MKAKQLIYTSWKNGSSTKKGFMVYSKSQGVTTEDENAIKSAMRYTTLPSLPYTPTIQEIENLFPRNVSYFRLPSGKYCFAQSSYVGADYTGRMGNYIIHAYICDNEPDFNQFNLIKSDVFRRFMTQEELDAESNPPPLPEAELDVPDNPDDIPLLQQFFTPEKKDKLRYLVEAVLQGINLKKTVYVFDDQPELALWYKALAYCYPKMTLAQVTYSTYSCYVPKDIAVACVKEGSIFNYDMNLAMGGFVYNFKEDKINDKIVVSEYTDRIVEEFYRSPAAAAAYASSLDEYMEEAHGDIFLAIDLSKFYRGMYNLFDTPETLGRIFGCVTASDRVPAAYLGDIIGSIITSNESFDFTENAQMYKYVMANGSQDMRFTIIKQYSDKCFEKAVDVSSYQAEYLAAVNCAPFEWTDFLDYVNKTSGKDRFVSGCGVSSFAAYVLMSTVLDYGTAAEQNDKLLPDYALTIAGLNDLSLFSLFFDKLCLKGVSDRIAAEITANGHLFDNNNYRHSFALLDIINKPDISAGACAYMIRTFGSDSDFTAQCKSYLDANPEVYAEVEKTGAADPLIGSFINGMISSQFLAGTPDDVSLGSFFDGHFARNDKMKDVFYKGLEKRLYAEQLYTVRARAALSWYKKISSAYPEQQTAVINVVCGVLFGGQTCYADFAKCYKGMAQAIDSFMQDCKAEGVTITNNYYDVAVLAAGIRSITPRTYKTSAFAAKILKTGLLEGYTDNFTGKTLAENHLEDIFNLYVIMVNYDSNIRQANIDFMVKVLDPLAEVAQAPENEEFCRQFTLRTNKLKGDIYLLFMSAVISYAVYHEQSALAYCMEEYFGGMQKKKIEKFYEELNEKGGAVATAEVRRYVIGKIKQSKNTGFFAKLFGKK